MSDFSSPCSPTHAEPASGPLVVGLGASAGGIKALSEFFTHVKPDAGVTYVVILHLSPDYESQLAEVLQHGSRIPVTQVRERVRVESDHVYVIPQNKSLAIADHHIMVSEFTSSEQRRAPVDLFFRTLADAHGSRSAVVILSGTGADGSAGLKRVKQYGGLTIVQDPDEAEYRDMPSNAIATGMVDLVLPVAQMPGRILEFFERQRRHQPHDDAEAEGSGAIDPDAMRDVLTVLRVRTGHDFSNYKAATLQRRVLRRVHVRGLDGVNQYARLIREHPGEAVALMKELLISVTNFFRDAEAFSALAARVVPRIFETRPGQEQVRVWVPGCATGEEAYSVAMLVAAHAATLVDAPPIQVFASDLDEQAIGVAREGLYTYAEVADVTEERLQRFFQKEAGGYRVRRELREMILFAQHNVIKDPPFSHLDLISCRNMLIYLNRKVQDRVIENFHFALRPGRYLFLGVAESADGSQDLFVPIDREAHIYESRTVATRLALPTDTQVALPRPHPRPDGRVADRIAPSELHHRLLEEYAPPSLVATDEHTIVHMSERVGRYLQVPGGEPSHDLMRTIRPELRSDLRVAMHEAMRQRTRVVVPSVRMSIDGQERAIRIVVKPALRDGDPPRGFMLIVFEESDAGAEEASVEVARPLGPPIVHWEEEISRLKQHLRVTIEQYETQVEEAKASNEELQAMNEELRSSAEELETSKEELQSVNEELTTVNQELKVKIEELGLRNNDFQNLINSSDVGTIFLDRSLRVKLSTPSAQAVFNLRPVDVGRPLSDVTSQISYSGVYEDVDRVLHTLETIEREVETNDGHGYVMRIKPYRTTDDRIDGVVITFQDITNRQAIERRLRQSEQRLRFLIDGATDYAIFTITQDGRIESWNAGAQRMFGYAADEIVGQPLDVLFTPEDRAQGVPAAELERAARQGRAPDERYHLRKNGERFYCSGVTTSLAPAGGTGFAKIARDLTAQRKAAEDLQDAHDTLERRVADRTRDLRAEVAERTSAQEQSIELLRKLVTSQEEERTRIARDLHDQIGQQVTALRLILERSAGEETVDSQLAGALALVKKIDSEVGFIAWELRPHVLDDLGLAAALPRFLREWSAHYGVAAEYRVAHFQAGELSPEAEVAFYRVAQEGLNNVAKHAHASRVDVLLETRGGVVMLLVEDDGVGFDAGTVTASAHGIGLIGMKERAALVGATLHIESAPGKGTSIFMRRRVERSPRS